MELFNGKANELFEDYLTTNYKGYKPYSEQCIKIGLTKVRFKDLPLSMQWGIIEDFARSLGYFIYIKNIYIGYSVYIDDDICPGHHILTDYIVKKTVNEARLECIKTLNDLINNED